MSCCLPEWRCDRYLRQPHPWPLSRGGCDQPRYRRAAALQECAHDARGTIGESAFKSCESLQSIVLPNNVTTIKKETFAFCEKLSNVTFPSSLQTISEKAFFSCESLNQVTLPNKTQTIGNSAFYSCKIKSMSIPKSVTSIEEDAFDTCSIEKLTIDTNTPDYKTATASPFYSARLTEIVIGENVTSIGSRTFDSGSIVTVGSKVSYLGEFALGGILKTIYCKPTTPPSSNNKSIFSNIDTGFKIYVPTTAVSAYKDSIVWGLYSSFITGYNY